MGSMDGLCCRIDDFVCGVTLGTGSFGRVRFATHRKTGRCYAIKMLKKKEIMRCKQVDHIISEKSVLLSLSSNPHPFIVNLFDSFQDERYIYMILDYICGGEFFTYLRDAGTFDCKTSQFYTSLVVLMFEYLHGRDIIYRDLKPENLLLDKHGYLKLTDFGFAKKVDFKTYTLCGTPEYLAPEVLLSKGHGKGVDWWTLGILMYEMMCGHPPFIDEDPMEIYKKILDGKVSFPRHYDKNAKALTKRLLTADLTKRYGCLRDKAGDVKQSRWLVDMDWMKLQKMELPAPIVPVLSDEFDTSNFDSYPDSDEEAEIPRYSGLDPFRSF